MFVIVFLLMLSSSYGAELPAHCQTALRPEKAPVDRLERDYATIFSGYLQRRLNNLRQSDREAVLARLAQSKVVLHDRTNINADALRGVYSVPDDFRGTFLLYLLLAHELEHLIQLHTQGWIKGLLQYRYQPSALYKMEKEAMVAEWNFMNLLPEKAIDEMIERIHKSKLNIEDQGVFRRIFIYSQLTASDYVRKQHQSGRYSLSNARRLVLENYLKLAGGLGISLSCAGLAKILM